MIKHPKGKLARDQYRGCVYGTSIGKSTGAQRLARSPRRSWEDLHMTLFICTEIATGEGEEGKISILHFSKLPPTPKTTVARRVQVLLGLIRSPGCRKGSEGKG